MPTDINSSTAGQICLIPGLGQYLAEKICQYRTLHGHFKQINDLWKVNGVNRSNYQILKRHFVVSSPVCIAPSSSKKEHARISLSNSIMNFVCQGSSVCPKSAKKSSYTGIIGNTGGTLSGLQVRLVPSGTTRNGTRYRIKPEFPAAARKVSSHKKEVKSAPQLRKDTPIKKYGNYIDACLETDLRAHRSKTETSANTDVDNETKRLANKTEKCPRISLETSPSGNNINFTCSIDKRLLNNPASMAIHFDDYGHPIASKAPITTDINYSTAAVLNPQISSHSPFAMNTIESTSGATGVCVLSQENMLLYDRKHKQNSVQKRQSISTWVGEVIVCRNMTPLLHAYAVNKPTLVTELKTKIKTKKLTNNSFVHHSGHPTYCVSKSSEKESLFTTNNVIDNNLAKTILKRHSTQSKNTNIMISTNPSACMENKSEKRSHPTSSSRVSSSVTDKNATKNQCSTSVADKIRKQRRVIEPSKNKHISVPEIWNQRISSELVYPRHTKGAPCPLQKEKRNSHQKNTNKNDEASHQLRLQHVSNERDTGPGPLIGEDGCFLM